MSETAPLSRIPFRVQDESMIANLAGWMRFVGLVIIVMSLIGFFVILPLGAFVGLMADAALQNPEKTVSLAREGMEKAVARTEAEKGPLTQRQREGVAAVEDSLTRLPELLQRNKWGLLGLVLVSLISLGLYTAAGMALWSAADDLGQVARTDLADQDLMAKGLGKVARYFKISVAITVITMVVSTVAALSFATQVAAYVGPAMSQSGAE